MKTLKDERYAQSDVLSCFVPSFNRREMENKDMNKDYKPAIMVDLFFINKLCFRVNPMRGGQHRMIYEKNPFGQLRYHFKEDHGLRDDAAYDLFHDASFIYFLYNIHQSHHVVIQVCPTRLQYALAYQLEH